MVSKTSPYEPAKAYYQSKLANLMHANHLTARLEGTGISVFSVHPGKWKSCYNCITSTADDNEIE